MDRVATIPAGTIAIGDVSVNRMGFGAMRLTGSGIWGPPANPRESIRVLQRAVQLGADFIDTADSYGPQVSELLIAEALYPYPEGLVIATKGGLERPGPNRWEPNGHPDYLRRQLEGSLRRLRLTRIDLYQLHRIDPGVPAEVQFETLLRFQQEGLVRQVGLSEASVADLQRARRVLPIVSVQNKYNVTDRVWEDVVDYAESERIAFIPWFPLSAGALQEGSALAAIAQRHGATVYQVALAWLLARSPSMLVIPGTSSVAHLEENIAAARLVLEAEDIARLNRMARQPAET